MNPSSYVWTEIVGERNTRRIAVDAVEFLDSLGRSFSHGVRPRNTLKVHDAVYVGAMRHNLMMNGGVSPRQLRRLMSAMSDAYSAMPYALSQSHPTPLTALAVQAVKSIIDRSGSDADAARVADLIEALNVRHRLAMQNLANLDKDTP